VAFGGVREQVAPLNGRELLDRDDGYIVFAGPNKTAEKLGFGIHAPPSAARCLHAALRCSTQVERR
jgi:hypothetical protein